MPRQKFAIELDGFRDHSSTLSIAKDRARERYLIRQGWLVIRYGGAEVHHNPDGCVLDAAAIYASVRGRR
jgi:very-short-patch-repair endonuclease